MKKVMFILMFIWVSQAQAQTLPFTLNISGHQIDEQRQLWLSDIGEGKTNIHFKFKSKQGKAYSFDLNYKKLAPNRSYPSNLDITLKDGAGNKLGYLFFAINKVAFLKQMGVFGFIIDVDGQPVDIQFTFDAKKQGKLRVSELSQERFVQDTLVPKFSFQMIRPVILEPKGKGVLSSTYRLDAHPYAVNYRLEDRSFGGVRFKHQLFAVSGKQQHLLETIYFDADSLSTLREAMYAGKYFHPKDGTFKLVFYPAMGQTEPR